MPPTVPHLPHLQLLRRLVRCSANLDAVQENGGDGYGPVTSTAFRFPRCRLDWWRRCSDSCAVGRGVVREGPRRGRDRGWSSLRSLACALKSHAQGDRCVGERVRHTHKSAVMSTGKYEKGRWHWRGHLIYWLLIVTNLSSSIFIHEMKYQIWIGRLRAKVEFIT
jgi:hypothetical protein